MLQADSIRKSYGSRNVLTSASLNAMPATVTAVVGNVGVGKSTLLRICAGLIAPDDGWVKFGEAQFNRPRLHEMSRAGLYFMGERSGLAESLTVVEHFDMIAKRFGVSVDAKLIDSFSLSQFLDSKPHNLSTGERRRAELAIAMSRRPTCLIADEPFRELDPITCELIRSGLRSLASDGCAVIVSGQEVHTIFDCSDCVTWVTAGTTYDLGFPEQASRDERFRREFLGPNGSL
jgi:lipopolysaccharide export system ATP-binding protein